MTREQLQQLDTLLKESFQFHRRALESRLRERFTEARGYLLQAQQLRLKALQLDPERRGAPWKREKKEVFGNRDLHAELMRFYTKQIAKEPLDVHQ